jgi:hypothetical protein
MEFACELDRRAVADIGQFLERDVCGDILFDIVFDQPCVGRPETSLRAGQFELDRRIFTEDVNAGLDRQRVVAEPPAPSLEAKWGAARPGVARSERAVCFHSFKS